MFTLHHLTLIPGIIAIVWALIVKIRAHNRKAISFILISGITAIMNGSLVYLMINDSTMPIWLLIPQALLSCAIVPQAYMYFSHQIGRRWTNETTIALLTMYLLLFIPSMSFEWAGYGEQPVMHDAVPMWHMNIFHHGHLVYSITMASVAILIQAILTLRRIPPMVSTMRKYELKFTPKMRFFFIWWISCILFIIFSSLLPMKVILHPIISWVYFALYGTLIFSAFTLLALKFDLHPVITEEGESGINIDEFIRESQQLAERARRLFLEERLYLQQGIVIDDVVARLGTNRTYFTRMMRTEFGLTFSEYVTNERLRYSEHLLTSTDKGLEEIAEESGFGNASAFCRVFKRNTGFSPDVWRKMQEERNS